MQSLRFVFALVALATAIAAEEVHKCSHVMKNKNHAVCSLFPESTEGPYYVDDQEVRQNITEGKPGIGLTLTMTVVNFTTCEPIPNVAVDIWHCDALGEYSSFVGVTLGPRPPPETVFDDNTFLRGVQYSDANGEVTFYTIFPGWYEGRTVHVHVDAHVNDEKHTGQLFFTETLTAEVARQAPYSDSTTTRLTNSQDGIYLQSDGAATTLNLDTVNGGYQSSILMGFEK